MKKVTILKKGAILEIVPIKTESIKDSDIFGKKIFGVLRCNSRWRSDNNIMVVDFYKNVFLVDGKLAYLSQLILVSDVDGNLVSANVGIFGFTRKRQKKSFVINPSTSSLSIDVSIKVKKENVFFY